MNEGTSERRTSGGRVPAALALLLALTLGLLATGRQVGAGPVPFRRPAFFEGFAQVVGRELPAPVWLALITTRARGEFRTHVYGIFGFPDEAERSRALGLLRDGAMSGNLRLLQPGEAASGSFQAALGPGVITGSFALLDGATGQFAAQEATMDAAAMAPLHTTWEDLTARAQGIDLEVELDSARRTMRARAKVPGPDLGRARGQWIVDTAGNLWLLLLDYDLDLPPFVGAPYVPREPVPVKARYRKDGVQLHILDPYDPSHELTTWTRK
jgi:hypothetical protein